MSSFRYGTVRQLSILSHWIRFSSFYLQFLFNNLVATPSFLRGPPPAAPAEDTLDEEADRLLSASLDETALLPADLGQSGFDVLPEGQHVQPRSSRADA